VALAALPTLIVLAYVFLVLFSFVLVLVGLIPIDEPMSLLFTPPLTVIFGIAGVLLILLLAIAFTVLGVLPISLFTELVCWRLDVHHILAKLAAFVSAGVLLGLAASGLGLLWAQPDSPGAAALVTLVLMLVSIGIVFLFGLVLTAMTAFKNCFKPEKSSDQRGC
jgi:hypothetical protein